VSTRTWIRTATVTLVLACSALANAQEVPLHLQGLIRTAPGSLSVLAESMTSSSAAIGLTVERVEEHVIRRLMRYGLSSGRLGELSIPADYAYLYINIILGPTSAAIRLELIRQFEFVARREPRTVFVPAYNQSALRTLGVPLVPSDTNIILDSLDIMLDIFIDDYLHANPRTTW
jgi:hypothetical protein